MDRDKEFEVEISNCGPKSYETAVTLELPATWAEFHDVLQMARIEDPCHCDNELTQIRRKELPKSLIGCNVNLLELNLLAQRLAMLTEEQEFGFEGLLKMEANGSAPIPLPRLINLTFNTERCCVASRIYCDRDLGALLLDSEMLPEEADRLLSTAEPDSDYRNSLLTVFGKKHREDNGGVFTMRGYVEASGEMQEIYIPGEMVYFQRSGAPVVLEVCGPLPDDPAYDNCLTATLDLPAGVESIPKAVEAVEAASIEECGLKCADCLIPSAKQMIDNAIADEGGIGRVNAFALLLKEKARQWDASDQIKYKALLEVSGCVSLKDAVRLAEEVEQYEIRPEIAEPWDYVEGVLRERYPDIPTVLFQTSQAMKASGAMLEQDHAALTSYGLIRRKDGQPLPELCQEGGAMCMGGM